MSDTDKDTSMAVAEHVVIDMLKEVDTVVRESKNSEEVIENVAEKILTQEKSVSVINENNQIIGTVHPSKIINTVFGGKKNEA